MVLNAVAALDRAILIYLNGFARHSWAFDTTVYFASTLYLLKGGVLVCLMWWAWFQPSQKDEDTRAVIVASIVGCLAALAVNRVLVHALPFRPRPIENPLLGLTIPYGMKPEYLTDWGSAFPSDHAVLFFSLAMGLYWASRRLGLVALIHSIVIVMFPRLYLGMHSPSDIVAGAGLGIGTVWLMNHSRVKRLLFRGASVWMETRPGLFYAVFFLVTSQIASLFLESRSLALFSLGLARAMFPHLTHTLAAVIP